MKSFDYKASLEKAIKKYTPLKSIQELYKE